MAKNKVHYLIPYTTKSLCGIEPYNNSGSWEGVTCPKCRKIAKKEKWPKDFKIKCLK